MSASDSVASIPAEPLDTTAPRIPQDRSLSAPVAGSEPASEPPRAFARAQSAACRAFRKNPAGARQSMAACGVHSELWLGGLSAGESRRAQSPESVARPSSSRAPKPNPPPLFSTEQSFSVLNITRLTPVGHPAFRNQQTQRAPGTHLERPCLRTAPCLLPPPSGQEARPRPADPAPLLVILESPARRRAARSPHRRAAPLDSIARRIAP